jgi:hypothetical protein
MPPTPETRCRQCAKPIRGRGAQARYCSVRCRLDAQIERRRQRTKKTWEGNLWRDGRYWLCCQRCDSQFWSVRRDAQYCSAACRVAAWRFYRRMGL